MINRLRHHLPPAAPGPGSGRGAAPERPNAVGLADPRNYDSVELASSLAWFKPLYDPAGGLSSRGESPGTGCSLRGRD